MRSLPPQHHRRQSRLRVRSQLLHRAAATLSTALQTAMTATTLRGATARSIYHTDQAAMSHGASALHLPLQGRGQEHGQ